MRIHMVPCQKCGSDQPTQIAFCNHCGHEPHRKGYCHCDPCMAAGRKGGWKALEAEEEAARWAFLSSLPAEVREG